MGDKASALRLLLVEENQHWANAIASLLAESGLSTNIKHVRDLHAALSVLEQNDFDVVLVELFLPDATGVETFDAINQFDIPIVAMAEKDNEQLATHVLQNGGQDYLIKNGVMNRRGLKRVITHAVERDRFIKNNTGTVCRSIQQAAEVLRGGRKQLLGCTADIGVLNDRVQSESHDQEIQSG